MFGIGVMEKILTIIWLLVAILVYKDATRRYPAGSFKPILWAIVVFFMSLIGLVLYLLLRPEKK